MTKEFDFYTGYEGEPELVISQEDVHGNSKTVIRLWVGFFDSIMELIKPNAQGEWEGVVLYYHTATGWYEISPWRCDDVPLLIDQLESIERQELDSPDQSVLDTLIETLKNAVNSNDSIYFDYQ